MPASSTRSTSSGGAAKHTAQPDSARFSSLRGARKYTAREASRRKARRSPGGGFFPVTFASLESSEVLWIREVQVPSKSGGLGILDGRRPIQSGLEDGIVRLRTKRGWSAFFVSGGVLKSTKSRCPGSRHKVEVEIYSSRSAVDVRSLVESEVNLEYSKASLEVSFAQGDCAAELSAQKKFKRAKAKPYAFKNAEAALTDFV